MRWTCFTAASTMFIYVENLAGTEAEPKQAPASHR
jgi:hypothetical protein